MGWGIRCLATRIDLDRRVHVVLSGVCLFGIISVHLLGRAFNGVFINCKCDEPTSVCL